ncbi:hypothetical protein [Mycolicibacterium sp.]|uniref:Rv1733c family protein n=1 Tax=Mycolicibacterium sp. TaxID=2320850 RepID=UPI0037C6369E
MDTFTVGLPRWPLTVRLVGRGPLVRAIDRIEALVVVLAVVLSLVAIPIAAAIGTAVYDSRQHLYADQAATRQATLATVTDVPASHPLRTATTTVSARWTAAGTQHTGTVEARASTAPGDTVAVWVDNTGAQTPAPTPTAHAAREAAIGAIALWIGAVGITATLCTLTRTLCDRIRLRGWQLDLEHLISKGGDQQYPGRGSQR